MSNKHEIFMTGVFRNTKFQILGVPAMNEKAALSTNAEKHRG